MVSEYPYKISHVNNFMNKQQLDINITGQRYLRTRAHDAVMFISKKPNCEKYMNNIFYHGALEWNNLPVIDRNTESYNQFKSYTYPF